MNAASYNHEDLVVAQRNDTKRKQVTDGIENNKHIPKEYCKRKLFMENYLLMYNPHNNYLVVCPSELRYEILNFLTHSGAQLILLFSRLMSVFLLVSGGLVYVLT